jgi:hypothetical protein
MELLLDTQVAIPLVIADREFVDRIWTAASAAVDAYAPMAGLSTELGA